MTKLDHEWPAQRSRNIEAMIEKARGSDAFALEKSCTFLDELGTFLAKLGDDNAMMLLAFLRTRLSVMAADAKKRESRRPATPSRRPGAPRPKASRGSRPDRTRPTRGRDRA